MRHRLEGKSVLAVRGGLFATRPGGAGLIILATAVALLVHADWLVGILLAACGSVGILLGLRKISSR